MQEVIKEKLLEIESRENVKIIAAIESGSRAWDLHLQTAIMMCDLSIFVRKMNI